MRSTGCESAAFAAGRGGKGQRGDFVPHAQPSSTPPPAPIIPNISREIVVIGVGLAETVALLNIIYQAKISASGPVLYINPVQLPRLYYAKVTYNKSSTSFCT